MKRWDYLDKVCSDLSWQGREVVLLTTMCDCNLLSRFWYLTSGDIGPNMVMSRATSLSGQARAVNSQDEVVPPCNSAERPTEQAVLRLIFTIPLSQYHYQHSITDVIVTRCV